MMKDATTYPDHESGNRLIAEADHQAVFHLLDQHISVSQAHIEFGLCVRPRGNKKPAR